MEYKDILEMCKKVVELNQQKYGIVKNEIDIIITNNIRDERCIERTLDEMLDILEFYENEETLLTFKRLCRHYFNINPQATADYINLYKEINQRDEKILEEDNVEEIER